MKAEITLDGKLEITPGSITELYAVRQKLADNWRLGELISVNDREFPITITQVEEKAPF